MGFGSYDESEQEQPREVDDEAGEDETESFHTADYEGSDGMADKDTKDMMKHL